LTVVAGREAWKMPAVCGILQFRLGLDAYNQFTDSHLTLSDRGRSGPSPESGKQQN
jgi:hypothetical protein